MGGKAGFGGGPAAALTNIGVFDALLDMNGNTPGTTASAAVLATGTVNPAGAIPGAGAWVVTGTAAGLTVQATQAGCSIPAADSLYVNTTQLTSSHASQTLAINNADASTYATATLAPNGSPQVLNVIGCYVPNQASASGSAFDLIRIQDTNGTIVVMQLNNGNCEGSSTYGLLLETSPGGSSGSVGCILVTPGQPFWYFVQDNEITGTATMRAWNSSGTLLSTNGSCSAGTCTRAQQSGIGISAVLIGNSQTGTDTSTSYFENTMFSFANNAVMSPFAAYGPTIWAMQSQRATAGAGTTVNMTLNTAPLVGDCLYGFGSNFGSTGTVSIADNINGAWTPIDSTVSAGQAWYKCGISSSIPTITSTSSNSKGGNDLNVVEFNGKTGTLDQHPVQNTGTAATATSGTTGTTTAANEFIAGACETAQYILSVGNSFIPDYGLIAGNNIFQGVVYQQVGSTGTFQVSMPTNGSGGFGCVVDTFK